MLPTTLPHTHYWPHDGDEQKAVCGASMHDDSSRHSLWPTCPACQQWLAFHDALAEACAVLRERSA